MRVGKVIGSIWATRKAACLQGQTFLVVESEGQQIVAADQVGAGEGDEYCQGVSPEGGLFVCVGKNAGACKGACGVARGEGEA